MKLCSQWGPTLQDGLVSAFLLILTRCTTQVRRFLNPTITTTTDNSHAARTNGFIPSPIGRLFDRIEGNEELCLGHI